MPAGSFYEEGPCDFGRSADPLSTAPESSSRTAQEIQDWIVARLVAPAGGSTARDRPAAATRRYGLDSVQFVLLITDLEQWLGLSFQKNPVNEQSTIVSLSEHLASLTRQA